MGNISLIVGTLLSQLSIGCFITIALCGKSKNEENTEKSNFKGALTAFIIGCTGLLAIITHLGHPFLAFNALFNVARSWLSREVVTYGGFLGFLFLYLLAEKDFIIKGDKARSILKKITIFFGCVAVVVTSMIYTIPGVPAWNSINTPVSFVLSAVLMGGSLGIVMSGVYENEGNKVVGVLLVTSVIAILTTLVYTTTLTMGITACATTAYLMFVSPMFWIRLALLALVVLLMIYGIAKKKMGMKMLFASAFCLLFASEVLGRVLFFSTIVRM